MYGRSFGYTFSYIYKCAVKVILTAEAVTSARCIVRSIILTKFFVEATTLAISVTSAQYIHTYHSFFSLLPKNSNDRDACLTLTKRSTYILEAQNQSFFFFSYFFPATQDITCHAYLCFPDFFFLSLYFLTSFIVKHRLVVH